MEPSLSASEQRMKKQVHINCIAFGLILVIIGEELRRPNLMAAGIVFTVLHIFLLIRVISQRVFLFEDVEE